MSNDEVQESAQIAGICESFRRGCMKQFKWNPIVILGDSVNGNTLLKGSA